MATTMSTSPSTSSSVLTAAELAEWSQSLKPVVLGLSITILVLSNMGVILRIWAQWRIQKRPMPEDYLLIMALFANVVSIAIIVTVHYGLGYHLFRVESEDPSGIKWIFLCVWLTATFNGPSMLATKVALLLYYRRLFIVQQIWLRIFWWTNMVYTVLWGIGSTITYMLSCVPVSYYWERFDLQSTVHGSCHNSTTADGLPLILDLVSDVMILVLPIATIATLQMPLARKTGLMIMFSVGFLAIVSAVARVVVLYKSTSLHSDFSYAAAPFELLDVIQLNMAIVCATAVPIASGFRVAFSKKRRRDKGWTAGGASRNTHHHSHASAAARAARLRLEDEAGSSTERLHMGHFTTSCASKDPEDRTPGGGVVSANGIMVKMDVDIR
ncbi:uncharacterized protein BO88DRAFT_426732 [Aspergillus vadensis CBS 113365]|uniref:Rhodopsin domain-containing protein n=1 Tax=Aspergillus vadensis (strain CBS 113365 / IMI 142717 / IBT 24658) TaxID=1448311 RepID=A0A319B6W5_ASPVC|nr:hypothetical protein BO88DRAFT_426732 [Aspergillus vadensis CBS 113365]PYH68089.1 hypothetical protein BO88DRAFT_426732 [Aspergillus vadensis CBS 113365]